MYLKKIKVFEQYCATKYSDTYNNNLWINTIEKFDLRDIKDSMIFYVTESTKSKKIAKASILRDYLMILVGFFRFLDKTLQITNTTIWVMVGSNDTIHPSLIEIIEEISNTYSLSMKRDQSPVISKDDAKKLVE